MHFFLLYHIAMFTCLYALHIILCHVHAFYILLLRACVNILYFHLHILFGSQLYTFQMSSMPYTRTGNAQYSGGMEMPRVI